MGLCEVIMRVWSLGLKHTVINPESKMGEGRACVVSRGRSRRVDLVTYCPPPSHREDESTELEHRMLYRI